MESHSGKYDTLVLETMCFECRERVHVCAFDDYDSKPIVTTSLQHLLMATIVLSASIVWRLGFRGLGLLTPEAAGTLHGRSRSFTEPPKPSAVTPSCGLVCAEPYQSVADGGSVQFCLTKQKLPPALALTPNPRNPHC